MSGRLDRDGVTVWVPRRAEGRGGIVGDGVIPLRPGDPGYAQARAGAMPRDADPMRWAGEHEPPGDVDDPEVTA